jgi:hypothetical protein
MFTKTNSASLLEILVLTFTLSSPIDTVRVAVLLRQAQAMDPIPFIAYPLGSVNRDAKIYGGFGDSVLSYDLSNHTLSMSKKNQRASSRSR